MVFNVANSELIQTVDKPPCFEKDLVGFSFLIYYYFDQKCFFIIYDKNEGMLVVSPSFFNVSWYFVVFNAIFFMFWAAQINQV